MDGLQHAYKKKIKWEKIPLNIAFCLTNYKVWSQIFDKLIVDSYNPPNHMVFIMHNIYAVLSHLQPIEGLIILWDIQIEDIKKFNFQEGAMKYMNPCIFFESPKEKTSMIL
jgi:hypothetical protein